MLDVEVVPEMGIRHKAWEFTLGMPIQQMIDVLKKQDQVIKSVNLWYNDKFPFSSNIVLVLPSDGLKFHFDPFLQRLRLIELFNMSKISLSYWSQYFNSPSVAPTIQEILRIFGSTKPLLPSTTDGDYRLCYRGITFILSNSTLAGALPAQYESLNFSGLLETDLLIATRLYIYIGNSLADAKISFNLPTSCYLFNVFLERLIVERSGHITKALIFHLVTLDLNTKLTGEAQMHQLVRTLHFGDSVQDVLSALGSPSRIFYKTEDKMKIHLPQSYRVEQPRRSDYFFNYFTLGLDVLFDARSHQAIKFVLHTNQPGEYTFSTYYRCLFEIPVQSLAVRPHLEGEAFVPMLPVGLASSGVEDTGLADAISTLQLSPSSASQTEGSTPVLLVTPFTKWSVIQKVIDTEMDAEPVVIHRETKPRQHPFGPTHAYGYQDMIFEVIPTSESLASVTLYATPVGLSSSGALEKTRR